MKKASLKSHLKQVADIPFRYIAVPALFHVSLIAKRLLDNNILYHKAPSFATAGEICRLIDQIDSATHDILTTGLESQPVNKCNQISRRPAQILVSDTLVEVIVGDQLQ